MSKELIFHMKGKENTLTYIDDSGQKRTKNVDVDDFVNSIGTSTDMDLGLLPPGLRYYKESGNEILAVIEVEARKHDVKYDTHDGKVIDVGEVDLPTGLFFFNLSRERRTNRLHIGTTYLFALRGKRLGLPTETLYRYPAPNVYDTSFHVCWGESLRGIRSLPSINSLYSIAMRYYSAPYNRDLFGRGNLSADFPWADAQEVSPGQGDTETYLNFLKDHPFDSSWLNPAPNQYMNFNRAISTIATRS